MEHGYRKCNEGVEKYLQTFRHRTEFIKDWYNHKFRVGKERRDRAWNR